MEDDKQTLDCAVTLAAKMIKHGSVKGVAETKDAIETLFFTLRGLHGERLAARDKAQGKLNKLEPAIDPNEFKGKEHNFVACLECGAKVKDLVAHLQKKHGMVWGEYRDKWEGFAKANDFELLKLSRGLSAKRSETAKAAGLGVTDKGEEPREEEETPQAETLDVLTLLERLGETLAKNPRRRMVLSTVARACGFADTLTLKEAIGAGFNSLCGLITIEEEEGGKTWAILKGLQA